jgi:hypothetical protein
VIVVKSALKCKIRDIAHFGGDQKSPEMGFFFLKCY